MSLHPGPRAADAPPRRRRRLVTVAALLAAGVGLSLLTATAAEAVPPGTVSTGPVSVSNITVNATNLNYAVVNEGTNIVIKGSYVVNEQGGAIDQIEIGWRGSSAPLGCVYSGGSGSGTFRYNLGPAPAVGSNQVIINFGQDFGCNTSGWWISNDGPVIADIVRTPPNSGSSGPVTVSNVKLAGTRNVVVGDGAAAVNVSGSWSIGDVGGAITQIQIGWLGAPLAQTCLANSGANDSGTFRVNLGRPPAHGANTIVIGYSQQFSCKRTWWNGSQPPATAIVGVYYDNES